MEKFETDCIHIHSCRRMAALARNLGHPIYYRGCNPETCTAYQSVDDFLGTIEIAHDFVPKYFDIEDTLVGSIRINAEGEIWVNNDFVIGHADIEFKEAE